MGGTQQAIEYLFDPGSTMDDHLEMLGGCAATMRSALLSDRVLGKGAGFTEEARDTIQLRRNWWIASRAAMFSHTPHGETA